MNTSSSQQEYIIGVMAIDVESKNSDRFDRLRKLSVQAFDSKPYTRSTHAGPPARTALTSPAGIVRYCMDKH